MSTAGVRRVTGVAILLAALAACTTPPAPRGTAFPAYQSVPVTGNRSAQDAHYYLGQSVPPTGDRRAQDAPYYLGADPDYPRGTRGGRGP